MLENYENFESEIISLIELKQEGPYWDFKRQWYDDKHDGDKLHDIICMANNLVDRDAYIIIGVDEENDYKLSDVSEDPNRRNTQQIINFIREKKFAGEYRPVVTVQTLSIENNIIDVIIIHNSNNTPFFLKKRYKNVAPSNIYIRYQDGNTPIDNSADLHNIEYLWKKRFGILLTPIQKFLIYLKHPEDWERTLNHDNVWYYKFAPEYTISLTWDDNSPPTRCEYYFFDYPDQDSHWGSIKLAYHQTLIKELTAIGLDGFRFYTTTPISGILIDNYNPQELVSYRYMIKGELNYLIHKFFVSQNDTDTEDCNIYESNILIFETIQEHDNFIIYAKNKWPQKGAYTNQIECPYFTQIANLRMKKFEEDYVNMKILNIILNEFRTN